MQCVSSSLNGNWQMCFIECFNESAEAIFSNLPTLWYACFGQKALVYTAEGVLFSRNFSTRVSCNLSCIHASFYRSLKAHGWYDGLSCNDAATSGPFDYCHYATKYFYYVAMKSQKIHPCLQFFWWRRCRWSKVRSKLRNKADRSQMVSFIPPKWRSSVMSKK